MRTSCCISYKFHPLSFVLRLLSDNVTHVPDFNYTVMCVIPTGKLSVLRLQIYMLVQKLEQKPVHPTTRHLQNKTRRLKVRTLSTTAAVGSVITVQSVVLNQWVTRVM